MQVRLVAGGQAFPVMVGQAMVRLRCSSITPAGQPCALLGDGSEVHVAPKPRIADVNAGMVPADATSSIEAEEGASSDSSHGRAGQPAKHSKQQDRNVVPAWLRVQNASSRWLCDVSLLEQYVRSPSSTGKSCVEAKSSHAPSYATAGSDTAESTQYHDGVTADAASTCSTSTSAAVSSWVTIAAFISHDTAHDLGLCLQSCVLFLGKGGCVPQLTLTLLPDDSVSWGHIALTPPLQLCLGVIADECIKLHTLPQPAAMKSIPHFLLHPVSCSVYSAGMFNFQQAAAANGPNPQSHTIPADVRRPHAVSSRAAAHSNGVHCLSTGHESVSAATTYVSHSMGSLASLLMKLLQGAQAPTASRHADSQEPQVQAQVSVTGQPGSIGLPARSQAQQGVARRSGDKGCTNSLDILSQYPELATHAVIDWMALQLAAAHGACCAVASSTNQLNSTTDSSHHYAVVPCAHGDSTAGDAAAADIHTDRVFLPMTNHPLVMHFRLQSSVVTTATSSGSAAACSDALSASESDGLSGKPGLSCRDFTALLLPQKVNGGQSAVSMPTCCSLPSNIVLSAFHSASTHHHQQRQQRAQLKHASPGMVPFKVQLAASVPVTSTSHSSVRQKHKTHLVDATALQPQGLPWLQPQFQAAVQRLAPRLCLKSWSAWRQAGLPSAGGVLISGTTGEQQDGVINDIQV